MADLDPIDALWFGAHPGETHRVRPVTDEERAAFRVRLGGFPLLLTIVRASDGARASYAFPAGCDVERALGWELAAWFDRDLDAAADLLG